MTKVKTNLAILTIRRQGIYTYKFLIKHGTPSVIIFSVLLQIGLVGKYLDNSIISPYAPTAMDALDYSRRAEIWRTQSFYDAFNDVSRMPGYPLILLINKVLFFDNAYLATRVFQLLALAISAGLIKITLQKFHYILLAFHQKATAF